MGRGEGSGAGAADAEAPLPPGASFKAGAMHIKYRAYTLGDEPVDLKVRGEKTIPDVYTRSSSSNSIPSNGRPSSYLSLREWPAVNR